MLTIPMIESRLKSLKTETTYVNEDIHDSLTLSRAAQEFLNWYSMLDERCKVLFNQRPLELNDIESFDTSGTVGMFHTSLFLLALESIDVTSLGQRMLKVLDQIVNPPKYVFGTPQFKVDEPDQHILCSQMQFVSNIDAFQVVQDALVITNQARKTKVITYDDGLQEKIVLYKGGNVTLYREADIMLGFVRRYVSQGRLLNIPKLIQFVFETSNFPDRGFTLQDNPILQVFAVLFRHKLSLPFTEKSGEMIYHSSVSMTTPHLCYALCQLWIQYILNDITRDELRMMVETYITASENSFDSFVLDFKDLRINSSKMLTEMVIEAKVPIYGHCAPAGVQLLHDTGDVWRSRERDAFGEEFCKKCPLPLLEYLRERGIIEHNTFTYKKIFQDDDEARRTHQVITFATQHGLFIKNPVILTMDRSINPRSSFGIGCEVNEEMVNPNDSNDRYPLTYKWHGEVLNAMAGEVGKFLPKYLQVLENSDLHQEFIRCLTNNSGGVPYEPSEQEKANVPSSVLKALGRKRLMFFLFNPTIFTTYSGWKRAVETVTSSGERKQVDRRGRVIQMVSNAAQLSAFLLFLITDKIGGKESEFESKKNSGTVSDMLFLLSHTASSGFAYECADVKGMDAATTKLLCLFTNEIVTQAFRNHPCHTYFWAQSKDWDIVQDGKILRRERIAAPIEVMRACEQFADTTIFRLREPETFGHIMTSPDAFPSGKFSTNSQHSLVNKTAVTSWVSAFNSAMLKVIRSRGDKDPHQSQKLTVTSLVSGDDLTLCINYGGETEEVLLSFSDGLRRWYANIGLTLESVLSLNSATFLQMTSILGKPWPKPDRIAITTSEHGDANRVEFVEAFSEVIDVLRELAGRSGFPSNWVPIIVSFANMLRYVRTVVAERIEIPDIMLKNVLSRGKSYYIKYPFFVLFVRNGLAIPCLQTNFNHLTPRMMSFAPRGLINDFHIRQILRKDSPFTRATTDAAHMLQEFYRKMSLTLSTSSEIITIKNFEHLEDKVLRSLYGTPYDWYDIDLASILQFDLIEYLIQFDPSARVKRARQRLIPKAEREQWANSLASQLNFQALTKSAIAHVTLTELRYDVPPEIAFHNSPNERVNQAIESLPGTHEEFVSLRRAFLDYTLKYRKGERWIRAEKDEGMLLFQVIELSTEYEPTSDAALDSLLKYMPASNRDFDRQLVIARFGYNFFDQTTTFDGYYGYKPGPWKDYNHEALVKFAAYVWHTNHDHLPYVWNLANIQGRHRRTLSRMIRTMDITLSSPWQSIIHTRQFFELGKSTRAVARCVEISRMHKAAIHDLASIIMRDILLTYTHYSFYKLRFIPHPLFIRIADGLRERNVLLRALTSRVTDTPSM